jgi:hypothetical protein
MINIEYENGIKITTGNLTGLFSTDQLPLKFQIKQVISKDIVWETNLSSNMWASYPNNEIYDVVVKDAQNNFIYQYYWDLMKHGSIFYKSLWIYCKSLINQGKNPNGLVIGTHDGEFGEWVQLARNFMSNMVLVEGSEKQYNKLAQNYQGREDIKCIFNIVTPDGGDVEFFEGGLGYTNTVVERVIRYWEKEDIKSNVRNSISLNNLIEQEIEGKLDWLHLDVEGLDVKLLLSIKENYLPNFIIFEDFNLSDEEKNNVQILFKEKNYNLVSQDGISMAIKI